MPRKPKDLAQRIEERSISEWSDDVCWLSDRSSNSAGYVQFSRNFDGICSYKYQHVIAWEMHNAEPVPEGMVVMHSCDNPGCFNPNHLSVGTPTENTQDSISKGRFKSVPPPERKYDYSQIHQMFNEGNTIQEIATFTGAHWTTVERVIKEHIAP